MKKRECIVVSIVFAILIALTIAISGCKKGNAQKAQSGQSDAQVDESTTMEPLTVYVKEYLLNMPAKISGDTSEDAIKNEITNSVKLAADAELEEQGADMFTTVDTQLTKSKKGYTGDVVVTYMTPPAYVASQRKANIAVEVGRGFFSWDIVE